MKLFTTTNLVHHLKIKHSEEFKRYTKLKEDAVGKKKAESSGSLSTGLRQADLCKIWDINDARSKRIHVKVGEMIAVDCQPVIVLGASQYIRAENTTYPVENIFQKL